MISHKIFCSEKINGYEYKGGQIILDSIGLFDSKAVKWLYFVVARFYDKDKKTNLIISILNSNSNSDTPNEYNIYNVSNYGKSFSSKEEAKRFIDDFRIKYETGSNDTAQEIRDKKIEELTND